MADYRLNNESISRLAETFASTAPSALAALGAVYTAAKRGAAVAMLPRERERLALGMAALERIIAATGGGR